MENIGHKKSRFREERQWNFPDTYDIREAEGGAGDGRKVTFP